MAITIDNAYLKEIFPAERTDKFFEALFGGAEEGAYDIVLSVRTDASDHVEMAFELHRRPGKCLVCSLTYGLSNVFKRHPVIDAAGVARTIAKRKGWADHDWAIGPTHEVDESYHWIPFRVARKC